MALFITTPFAPSAVETISPVLLSTVPSFIYIPAEFFPRVNFPVFVNIPVIPVE